MRVLRHARAQRLLGARAQRLLGIVMLATNAKLPRHLVDFGMRLSVDAQDAPLVEGHAWAKSRGANEFAPQRSPELIFRILLADEEVCAAKIHGCNGFPDIYQPALAAAYPLMRSNRTLALSSVTTSEPYRRMGCATALLDASEAWLREHYAHDDVEIMWLLDHSRLPNYYTARGWRLTVPLSWTILTKPLWPATPDPTLLEDTRCLAPAIRIAALSQQLSLAMPSQHHARQQLSSPMLSGDGEVTGVAIVTTIVAVIAAVAMGLTTENVGSVVSLE